MVRREDGGRWLLLLLLLWLAVACRSSEQATPAGAPSAGGSAGAGGSAAAPARGDVSRAPAPPADAAARPLALVDEMRALADTSGDRTKAKELHRQALKVHATLKFAESERIWAEAARADPSWNVPFYNLACTSALQAHPLEAIAYLEMVRDRNPDREMLWRIEHDGELRSIRSRPEYEALVIEIEDGIRSRANQPAGSGSGGPAVTSQERRPR
jgi:hypothetical protein